MEGKKYSSSSGSGSEFGSGRLKVSSVGNPSQSGVSVTAGLGLHPPENHSQVDLSVHGRSGNSASTSQVFRPPDGPSSLQSQQQQQQQRCAVEWEHREGVEHRFVAGESSVMQADVASPEMGVMLVPLTGNQLTLAFKGEVYVFDCVSQEKVQAVLLLLGGREVTSVVAPVQSYTQYKNMTPNIPQRAASLMRFREKKKERNFNKKIHHNVRKEVERRLERYKDQFLRAPKSISEATSSSMNLDANQSWGVPDGCLQASDTCHQSHLNAISTPAMHHQTAGTRNLCDTCGITCSNTETINNSEENPYIPPQPEDHTILPNEENPGNRPSAEQSHPVLDTTSAQAQPP